MNIHFSLFIIYVFLAGVFAMIATAFWNLIPLIGTAIFSYMAVRHLMDWIRS